MTSPTAPHFCAACGAARGRTDRFCAGCGEAFEAAPGEPKAPARPLDLTVLSPVPILRDRSLWRPRVVMFVIAAVAPFVLLHWGEDPGHFHDAVWGFALYLAAIWFVVFQVLVRPEPVRWAHLLAIAACSGVVGGGVVSWLESLILGDDPAIVEYIAKVGLPEEGVKLLAVLVVVQVLQLKYSPRTYLFLGAVSGLAFGAAEAADHAFHGASFTSSASDLVVIAVWRLLSGSLAHACLAGITAFFLGLAREQGRHTVALVLSGLLVAGVLHGIYDDVQGDWVAVLVVTAVVLIFVSYAERGEQVLARLAAPASTTPPPPLPADAG